MKPTQEQVIAWAQEACGDPAWEGGVEWVWGEVRRFATIAYDAGRKDENEACARTVEESDYCDTRADRAAAIRARREQ